MSSNTLRLVGSLSIALMAACASSPDTPAVRTRTVDLGNGWTLAQDHFVRAADGRSPWVVYVPVQRINERWALATPAAVPENDETVELMGIDLYYKKVAPAYSGRIQTAEQGVWTCGAGPGGNIGKRSKGYNACTSHLTMLTTSAGNVAWEVATSPILVPLQLLSGSKMVHVRLNQDEIGNVFAQVPLIERAQVLARERQEQRFDGLRSTPSVQQIDAFLQDYRDFDPAGKVAEASALRVQTLEQAHLKQYRDAYAAAQTRRSLEGFIAAYGGSGYDPEGLVDKARQTIAASDQQAAQAVAERRREADRARAQLEARASGWRAGLAVGSDTNCGPVIELRDPMVKVYFPVAGFGNEQWIRSDRLFPPGSGCIFVNGQYKGPS